jgi:hypothetical protein
VINQLGREGLYSMGNLRSINSYFLAGRSADFVIKTVQLLPIVLNKQSPFYYGRPNGSYRHPPLQRIFQGFDLLNTLNGKAIVFAGGLALYLLIKNRREQAMALIMILSTVITWLRLRLLDTAHILGCEARLICFSMSWFCCLYCSSLCLSAAGWAAGCSIPLQERTE